MHFLLKFIEARTLHTKDAAHLRSVNINAAVVEYVNKNTIYQNDDYY